MPPFIEVSGLSKSFGGHGVIDNLSLSVAAGEVVVFQGPSGIGKSTFLRCLTYLEPFQKGAVRVDGSVLEAGMDEKKNHAVIQSVREKLGFVFQFFNLFPHLTVLDNLVLAPVKVKHTPPEQAREEALALLRRVGLENKASLHPHALSGGQQQRVAIARALALRPQAVLFDEPTSSLDPAMKGEIIDVMENFARDGLTMLTVTHEPHVVSRIATRVVEFGPRCAVISDSAKK